MRLLPAAIELVGYAAVMVCIYLVNPVLLIGAAGLAAIGIGLALQRALEKPE